MKKIGVIVNPLAKQIRKGKISIESLKALNSETTRIDFTSSRKELAETVARYKADSYDYIGITGGDGSLHVALTEIINAWKQERIPPVLTFRGGTMNNVARSVGVKGGVLSVLERFNSIMEKGTEPEIVFRRTIKIGNNYCFLFGFGLVTRFLNEVYSGNEKGFSRNSIVICKAVSQALAVRKENSLFEKTAAVIEADGSRIELTEILAVLAGTVEHVGMGFTPLKKSLSASSGFQAIVTATPPRFILRKIFSLMKGEKIVHPLNYDELVNELTISSDRPFQYTMDGDLYESDGNLKVETGPVLEFVLV